ncbi:MAG: flagellar hook-length control protein FliK [Pseudomonadota bacterium]
MINIPPKPQALSHKSPIKNAAGQSSSHGDSGATVSKADSAGSSVGIELLKRLQQGQQFKARVESSQILSASDRQRLQQVNLSLLQQVTGRGPLTAGHAGGASGPAHNQASAQGATEALYLVKLRVESTSGTAQTLATLTRQALPVGQILSLTSQGNSLSINPGIGEDAQAAASSLIKAALPKLQDKTSLYPLLNRLDALPKPLKDLLIHPTLQQSIQQLNRLAYTSQSLGQANALKQALQQLLIPTEGKLAHSLGLKQDLSSHLQTMIATLQQVGSRSSPGLPPVGDAAAVNQTVNQTAPLATHSGTTEPFSPQLSSKELDSILRELTQFSQAGPGINAATVAGKTLPTSTAALFRLLGLTLPQHAVAQNLALPKIIEHSLRQLTEQTQARLQLNQIRSLGLDKSASDTKPLQQFHAEIPLRFNEQVLPMQLSIEQQLYRHRDSQDQGRASEQQQQENTQAIKRQWQVLMSFDLPNDETLHIQLSLIEQSVTSILWAESPHLCEKATHELSVLRDAFVAKGLKVDDIQCLQGQPPQKILQPDYRLIDVKT